MEVVHANGKLMKVKEFSPENLKTILEASFKNLEDDRWIVKHVLGQLMDSGVSEESRNSPDFFYLIWTLDNKPVAYVTLNKITVGESASIDCTILEEGELLDDELKFFMKSSIEFSFEKFNLEKLFFLLEKDKNAHIDKLLFEEYHPYPIGWIHFNTNKFVLTRGLLNRTEEDFYKIP